MLQPYLDFAVDAATAAGQLTLRYFRSSLAVELKSDGSPVTRADREAEDLLRQKIGERFPGHAVVGEERGARPGDSGHRWWIDPIDGTRAFVRGVPLYGVLLGLEIDGDMKVGVAHFPALGETLCAAAGLGCFWNGQPARVSSVGSLAQAAVLASDAFDVARQRPKAWARWLEAGAIQRGWGDCYGHCLVATGRAEVMLDPIMNPWDCAALVPILREAGGTFTDWEGAARIDGGSAVSTNGLLFDVVQVLNRGD